MRLLWSVSYIEVCCFIYRFLEVFLFFVLLIYSLNSLSWENALCIVSVLLNLMKFVTWPGIWAILVSVLGALKLYFAVVKCWCVLCMSVGSLWLIVLSRSSVCLLLLYLVVPSVTEKDMLKSTTIIADLSILFLKDSFARF